MSTRSLSRRWLAPAALMAVALLFACLKGREPTDASASDARFDFQAQVSGGSTLHIVVVYLDQGTTSDQQVPVTLLDKRITVAAGTQSLPLTIDLTRCLADPLHVPQGSNCQLFAAVTLLQGGSVIDSVSVGPVTVTPGQTVHANASLTPVGRVDVYPPSATINVGATTQLYDTVFSPTDSILPGSSVTWTSRNPAIATVNTSGLVTGAGAGTTTVVASVGGQQDSATITVNSVSTGGGGGITFPGLGSVGNTVTFSANVGSTLPVPGYVPVASADTTTVVSNLVATITPSSASAWLVANVSDSSFGSRVTHAPGAIRMARIRKQTSGSGVTTPATVDVHPTTTNLTAGTYNATVTVTGSGGASASFSVVYTVSTAASTLGFQPNPIVLNQYAYGSTISGAATSTAISSGGALGQLSESGNIAYLGADTGWLAINSVSGTTITVQPKTTSLHLGTDTANIPFTAVGATNNPQNLQVLLTSWVTYTKVVLGASFGCGLTTAATVYCWGGSGQGELGDGGTDLAVLTPVRANIPYSSSNPVIDVEAGANHACALQQSGAVYCWGQNTNGQLGLGNTTSPISTPTLIASHTYQVITLGAYFSCGIEGTPSNRIPNYYDCWGNNTAGQFGNGTTNISPTTLPALISGNTFYSISAGSIHMCGVTAAAGQLYCWGNDANGQLGNGYANGNYPSQQFVNVLLPTGGPATITSVSAGTINTCAVDNAGNGYCWGDNAEGEVGLGSISGTPVLNPTVISGNYSWTSISVGALSVCGIASSADLCWGADNYGQLANGQTSGTGTPTPTVVIGSGSSLFTEFTVGEASNASCFINSVGVFCAGDNSNGQLGQGNQTNTPLPTAMVYQPAPGGVGPSRVVPRRTVMRAKR